MIKRLLKINGQRKGENGLPKEMTMTNARVYIRYRVLKQNDNWTRDFSMYVKQRNVHI